MAADGPVHGHPIGRVGGIEIRLHWSVVVIAGLICWSLAEVVLPDFAEGHTRTGYWVAGALSTAAFLASLLAHELAHSLTAIRSGAGVTSITLWMLGGIAALEREPANPREARRVAAAGPATSAGIGLLAIAAAGVTGGMLSAALAWLGLINVVLAAFNLLPAFPMDGGRLYQAWRWERTGDRTRATAQAVSVGGWIGAGLIVFGIAEVLVGGVVGGLWMVIIGAFLREAGRAELQHVRFEGPLREYTVGDVMTPDPHTVEPVTTVAHFVDDMLRFGRHAAYPVVHDDGSVVGLIDRRAVASLPRPRWTTALVRDVMDPVDSVVVLTSSLTLENALAMLGRKRGHRALVIDDGRLVGIIAPSDIVRLLSVVALADDSTSEFPSRSDAFPRV